MFFYLIESFCYIPYRCSICEHFVILQTSTWKSSSFQTDKLLKPRQPFWITQYIANRMVSSIPRISPHLHSFKDQILIWRCLREKKVCVNWVCSEMGHACRHLSRLSAAIILKCWHYTNNCFCITDNLQSPCLLWCTSTLPLDRGPSTCPVGAYHSGSRTLKDWR